MIRYKCTKCSVRLESPSELSGQNDTCPSCGHVCVVPTVKKTRRRLTWIALVAAFLLLIGLYTILWRPNETTDTTTTSTSQPATQPAYRPIKVEYLKEASPLVGGKHGGGYYAWILVDPLTKPELERLGQSLLERMRRHRGDHLKVWIHYNRPSNATMDYRAVWMNATAPDYDVRLVGIIPKVATRRGLYEAYVNGARFWIVEGTARRKDSITCEYKPDEDTLAYHDANVFAPQAYHMPAIILRMSGDIGYLNGYPYWQAWSAIPGLKRVIVHLYQKDDSNPVATISFDRRAFEQGARLGSALWEKRPAMNDVEHKAFRRHLAKVMSDDEYKAICDSVARKIYKLYEDDWVKLFPMLEFKLHRQIGPAPSDFYRTYLFGK